MDARELKADEWRVVQGGSEMSGKAKRRAQVILEKLAEVFNDQAPEAVIDIRLTQRGEDALRYDFECEYGAGRFVPGWGIDDGSHEIVCELVFERKIHDELDRVRWQPCLCVVVSGRSIWKIKSKIAEPSDIANWPAEDRLFALGMMLKYVVINGPVQ